MDNDSRSLPESSLRQLKFSRKKNKKSESQNKLRSIVIAEEPTSQIEL